MSEGMCREEDPQLGPISVQGDNIDTGDNNSNECTVRCCHPNCAICFPAIFNDGKTKSKLGLTGLQTNIVR